jgi:RNA polymerase sigma-70 factor, ECF subfamily
MPPRLASEELAGHVSDLLRYARTVTGDPASAEDLVQDTLLRALERQDQFRGDSSLRTWLHRILHNRAVDVARAARESPDDDAVERAVLGVEALWRNDTYTVDAAEVVVRAEARDDLREALVHLPYIYRSAVVLHDAEGLTARDVARVMGIELPAAKQRIRRGRMMLVTALARGQDTPAAASGVPLRCWQARSRVSDYLDGELPPDDRERVERHLEVCPSCPPLYDALVGTRAAMSAQRDPDSVVNPAVARRIAAGLPR